MPKHYAVGKNIVHRTAYFNNTKTAVVYYGGVFDKVPMIALTPNDSGTMPLYKRNATTSSVTIRCKISWVGSVDITITERS